VYLFDFKKRHSMLDFDLFNYHHDTENKMMLADYHQSGPNISWEAQLNNVADTLATKAKLEILPIIAKKHQCTYPAVQIYLTINKTLITRLFQHKS
jgi:hypothetical protein